MAHDPNAQEAESWAPGRLLPGNLGAEGDGVVSRLVAVARPEGSAAGLVVREDVGILARILCQGARMHIERV